jgi:DNA invertase Pin-like site-specific DNA recombinase
MMGVFAEFERAIIRERVIAGLRTAKKKGVKLGRRRIDGDKVGKIRQLRAKGYGMIKIAREVGRSVGSAESASGVIDASERKKQRRLARAFCYGV